MLPLLSWTELIMACLQPLPQAQVMDIGVGHSRASSQDAKYTHAIGSRFKLFKFEIHNDFSSV